MSRGGRSNHVRSNLTHQRENETNQISELSGIGNPVALMARMEAELNDIRRLAVSRGSRYQSAIRRLDCLEEALLAMFEVRLHLMENIIQRPRFAAASHSLSIPSPSGIRRLPAVLEVRDLQQDLYFLKNRVRILQRRLKCFNETDQHPSTSFEVAEQPREVSYAQIIKRELEKIVREEEAGGNLHELGHCSTNSIPQAPANCSNSVVTSARNCTSRFVTNKRSKFTC